MKKLSFLAVALFLLACGTQQKSTTVTQADAVAEQRSPAAVGDLTGTYLGEGLFEKRTHGLRRPAMRIYLERVAGESDSYYGVLVEYDQLLAMAAPYLATQKAPVLNKVIGYLNNISTRISAYKLVPGHKSGIYEMLNLVVKGGQIVPAGSSKMFLSLNPKNTERNPLAGAVIGGNSDGTIVFPGEDYKSKGFAAVADAATITQYELANVIYKKAHLASTWRGNWQDLEGSYLSEYGRFNDGVLELSTVNGVKRSKFIKTNTTKAKYFTNPKSAYIEGDYYTTEPIPKMYVLTPVKKGKATPSDIEMTSRIGVFLDVFDASAPEAGGHMVTELAHINPQDPEDFMMYYEHPEHLKNVGVEPKK